MSQFSSHAEPVLVLGGTGHLGRDIVESLLSQNLRVRIFARTPGKDPRVEWARGNLATGEGLAEACCGVRRVIHAATNSPIAQRGSIRPMDFFRTPRDVDIDGTQRVIEMAGASGIAHFLFVSIVGLEDSKLPYSRIKLAGEQLVRESALPWSIVRATPFFYLIDRMLNRMHGWSAWCLPSAPFQPVDTRDVADYLVQRVHEPARGMLIPISGPEITSYAQMARTHLAASGISRRVLEFSLSERWARQAGIVALSEGVRGVRTWQHWLAEQTAGIG